MKAHGPKRSMLDCSAALKEIYSIEIVKHSNESLHDMIDVFHAYTCILP